MQAGLPVEQAGLVPVEPAAEDPLAPPTEASRGPIHHPAATAVLLQHFASAFGEAIDPARRRRLADLLLQLEDGDDPASWWSDLYPLIRAQLIRGAD